MKKIFIVSVDSFELKIVTEMLKRNNKDFVAIKKGEINDQAIKKVEKAIKNKKELIFVGCEPEYFGENIPKYKVITYKSKTKEEKTILKRAAEVVAQDVLDDFEKVVAKSARSSTPSIWIAAGKLGYSRSQEEKIAEDILKGRALYKGGSRKAWKDANKAMKNKKKMGRFVTVVEYDHRDYDTIVSLAYGQCCNLLILNKNIDEGMLVTYEHDLAETVQASSSETWTQINYSEYRVIFKNIDQVKGAVMRYHSRR
jgi:hypothetical protein